MRIRKKTRINSQAGISMIELMMASTIMVIGSLGMIGLIVGSIATNNRNKLDSTQTMLAASVLEQINSTIIGVGSSNLIDCGGTNWDIDTAPGGASLSASTTDLVRAGRPPGYTIINGSRNPAPTTGTTQATNKFPCLWVVMATTITYI